MAARSNACSELTRFWLEARLGYLVHESVPVPVPYALSDIDFLAMQPRAVESRPEPVQVLGLSLKPRLIVETKDEHDWEASGREFGNYLQADIVKMGDAAFIPLKTKGVKFTMLRQEHYRKAEQLFGTDDFDRLFVVHALDPSIRQALTPELSSRRIFWLTVPELVQDLVAWYRAHPRPAALRNTLVGDLLHLLVGFCGLSLAAIVSTGEPGSHSA
jgi:hypothetical protein